MVRIILPGPPADLCVDVDLVSVFHLRHPRSRLGYRLPPFRLPSHLLTYISHGSNRIGVDGVWQEVTAGQALWAPAGARLEAHFGDRVRLGVVNLHFHTVAAPDDRLPRWLEDPSPQLLRQELDVLCRAVERDQPDRQALALAKVFLQWAASPPADQAQHLPPLVGRALDLLATSGPRLDRAALATACGVSPSHLSRSVREATGRTLRHWHSEGLERRARDLLADLDLDITGVAEELGFDVFGFSRWFKRQTGLSPSAWRRRLPAY